MSDQGPDDIIDYSGTKRSLGEKRDTGFQMMKQKMLEHYTRKMQHLPPMIKAAKLHAYSQALDDAWNVFAQIVDVPTDEELSPG